jgi:two-component system, chemotaxis family, sensor kinase CheA
MLRARLDAIPESILRAAYTEAHEEGRRPLLARLRGASRAEADTVAARLAALPGLRWTGRFCDAEGEVEFLLLSDAEELAGAAGAGIAGFELEALAPAALCLPRGQPASPDLSAFIVEANHLVVARDALGLWRATRAALATTPAAALEASVLRWLTCILETAHPDRDVLTGLLESLGEEADGATSSGEPALAIDPALLQCAQDLLVAQLALLDAPYDGELFEGCIRASALVLERQLEVLGQAFGCSRTAVHAARDHALERRDVAPLRALVANVLAPRDPIATSDAQPAPSPASVPRPEAPERTEDRGGRMPPRVLKVDPQRIDALMGLVGELVVAKNSLPFLAQRAERDFASRVLAREIKERYTVINRITEELQGAVMRTRMVPLDSVFGRFPRLVRDVANRLGKQIRLDIIGEETEADRTVAEQLFDPLVHLLRNSMDHGLETPEERGRSGKSPEGRILLRATQADESVVIEVEDDGRGIDPARVGRKALEKGLVTADELAKLSANDTIQFVFAAGFSTAERVSDLSGRGVGMDVVRTMVAEAGGTTTLTSEVGLGTKVRIVLPTTLAVTRVMVVEIGSTVLGIPFASIVETVRLKPGEIHPVASGEVMTLRKRLVPLLDLARVLALDESAVRRTAAGKEPAVLVTRVAGNDVGLKVDDLQGNVDVLVKPVGGVLRQLKLIAGTALLGDGRVLLVLDPDELVATP